MELLRHTKNVWGQKMLVGVSWDLLWVPVVAALVVIVVHFLVIRPANRRRRTASNK